MSKLCPPAAAISSSSSAPAPLPIGPSAPSPFTSLFDFCERFLARGPGVLNKATIESLIKCGAFDALHGRADRAALAASIDQAVSAGSAEF